MRRTATSAGFTFIEMMIVIAILSLLASIVVVNMEGMSSPTRLRGAARSLGNEILQLKETATLRNRAVYLEIDVDKERWRVIDPPSIVEFPDPRDREENTFYGEWSTMPPGVHLEEVAFSATDIDRGTTFTVDFEPDGEISPSGFVAFFKHERLSDDDGISVEVSGLTGLITYHNGKFRAEEIRKPEEF